MTCTGVFKMIVGVSTTCHTQYTWDRSICIFLFNRTTLQVFVTYLTGALYVHPVWFYKYQQENRVRSKLFATCQHVAFSLPFAAILVNCAPSGEMHNYCTPPIIKENSENFLIHRCNYILISQVYCVWQVVKTPTIIFITLYLLPLKIVYLYLNTCTNNFQLPNAYEQVCVDYINYDIISVASQMLYCKYSYNLQQ